MDTGPAAIGRYQVRARLGQGGMGVLYLALDPAIDRLIALKLLRVDDDALRERFLREARLAARLQHPNIVTIYDVGSHEGQPFIAMEYIAGETLAELIQRRAALTPLRKLELLLDACQGLAYAHKNGIVHRDIKPANLMVNRDNDVLKVLDFGIARGAHSNLTQIGMLIGTPNYMAPEQVEGKPVDHRADVFALGLVLYELLVYRQAFKADTPHAVLHQVMHLQPTPVHVLDPALDPALASIIDKAIAKDPAARYADLERLRLDLVRIIQRLKAEQDDETVIVADHDGETRLTPGMPSIATRAIEQERDAREIQAWMEKARALFVAGSLTQAGQAVMEALQIDRQHAGAQALRAEIDRAFEERDRHRERTQAVSRALVRADESVKAGALDTALRATGEALGYDPGNVDALAKRSQVLSLVDRQATAAIAEAREHIAAGRRDQALQRLQDFSPWHEGVEAALVALRQELGLPAQGLSGAGSRSGLMRPQAAGTVAGWTPHPASGAAGPGAPAHGFPGSGPIAGGASGSHVGAAAHAYGAASTPPGATGSNPGTGTMPGAFGGATAGAGAAGKRTGAIAAVAVTLLAGASVAGWYWSGTPRTVEPPQNASLERPASPSGSSSPSGSGTGTANPGSGSPSGGNAASGNTPTGGAPSGNAASGNSASGNTASGKPSGGTGDPSSAGKTPTSGGASTPAPPGAGSVAKPSAPLPPPPDAAGPPVAPVPPIAGVDPAVAGSFEAAMANVQKILGRRDIAGLDALDRTVAKLPNGPKMHEAMKDAVAQAETEADNARKGVVDAQPGLRGTPQFQAALGELRQADRAKRQRRPIEAIRRYWTAQSQFAAMMGVASTRGPRTTTTTGTPASGSSSSGSEAGASTPSPAVPAAPDPPKPEAPRPADPGATTAGAKPTQPAPTPPGAPDARPPENRPVDPKPAVDNRAAIQQALDRFAAAYSTLKASSLKAVWVTMLPEQVASLDGAFSNTEQYTVALSNCRISEVANGTRATADCARATDIRYKNGTRNPRMDHPRFTLEKRGADWVIVGVQVN